MYADGLAQPEPGATVQLTLDRSIQAIADTALADSVNTNKAKSGVAVVLDVATGRVLAMATYPTYDPNTGEGHAAGRNRPVTDVYEAGSVMKVFSVASALEEGIVRPDTEFDLTGGQFKVGPKTIRDVHVDPYLTVSGIIKRSSNVGAAKIAMRLGGEKLYAGLKKFGFGTKTGIELPGEQHGMLRDGARWRDIELATISFGYGLTVTPLQIAAALAAIGNRGLYHEPRIVEKVSDADGTVLYEPARRPSVRSSARRPRMRWSRCSRRCSSAARKAAPRRTSWSRAFVAAARPAPRTSTIPRPTSTRPIATCRRSPGSRRSIIRGSRSSS